ncbi:HIT family protein [Candidatus Uhrbacteria bacterium]|nr:HIT family protein [Candidatus Uhrbacteria bacterium]
MTQADCLACDVNAGRIQVPGGFIHRDDKWVVDHIVGMKPGEPIPLKGFLIICPSRHVERIDELTPWEMSAFSTLLRDVTRAVGLTLKPQKIYVCSFGEAVKHVHWYVIPRYAEMPASGIDVLDGIFREKRWTCAWEDAEKVAGRIKTKLRRLIMVRQGETGCGPFDGGL